MSKIKNIISIFNEKKIMLKFIILILLIYSIFLIVFQLLGLSTKTTRLDKFEIFGYTKAGYLYKSYLDTSILFRDNFIYSYPKESIEFENPGYILYNGYDIDFVDVGTWYDDSIISNWISTNNTLIINNQAQGQATVGYDFNVLISENNEYEISITTRRLSGIQGYIEWYLDNVNTFRTIDKTYNIGYEYSTYTDTRIIHKLPKDVSPFHIMVPSGIIEISSIRIKQVGTLLVPSYDNSIMFTSSSLLDETQSIDNVHYRLRVKNIYFIIFALLCTILVSFFIYYYGKKYIHLITRKVFIIATAIFISILFIFQFWFGFPGFINNYDNILVMKESLSGQYENWHPIIIGLSLNILYKIFGYHTYYIFLIDLICWYLGLFLIIVSLYLRFNKKIFFLLFLLTGIANIYFQNLTQVKDFTVSMFIWLVCSIILFNLLVRVRKKIINILLYVVIGFILLLSLLWRHNMIVTIYPIFIYLTYIALKNIKFSNIKKYLIAYISSMFIIALMLILIVKIFPTMIISKESDTSKNTISVMFKFDIASIAARSGDSKLIPKEWYNSGRDFNYLKDIHDNNPYYGDNISGDQYFRPLRAGYEDGMLKIFIQSIAENPFDYIAHKIGFSWAIFNNDIAWLFDSYMPLEYNQYPDYSRSPFNLFPENETSMTFNNIKGHIYLFLFDLFISIRLIFIIPMSIILFFATGLIWMFKNKYRSNILLFTFSTAFSAFATIIIVCLFSAVPDNRYLSPILPLTIVSIISFIIFLFETRGKCKETFNAYN